jgi:pyrroloquinoline quinone biosynthesis protein E
MPEPCQSCPARGVDFGGCRCQAALLTARPENTDPVCEFSPQHTVVEEIVEESMWAPEDVQWIPRSLPLAKL